MKSGQESVVASRFTLQTAVGLLVGIAVLYLGREFLIPIALALLLSFLLAPAMVRLQRWGMGKTFAALLVVALSFSGLILICWAGLGQVYSLSLELPAYRHNISTKLNSLAPRGLNRLGETQRMMGEVTGELIAQNQAQKSKTSSKSEELPNSSSQRPIAVEVRQPDPTPLEFLKKTAGSVLRPLARVYRLIGALGHSVFFSPSPEYRASPRLFIGSIDIG